MAEAYQLDGSVDGVDWRYDRQVYRAGNSQPQHIIPKATARNYADFFTELDNPEGSRAAAVHNGFHPSYSDYIDGKLSSIRDNYERAMLDLPAGDAARLNAATKAHSQVRRLLWMVRL